MIPPDWVRIVTDLEKNVSVSCSKKKFFLILLFSFSILRMMDLLLLLVQIQWLMQHLHCLLC